MASALPYSRPLTVDDMEDLPDDGHRYELVDGALVVTPAPGSAHQDCAFALAILLRAAVRPDQKVMIAPFDWVVGQDRLFQPDVLVARRADVGPLRLERPPLLAVEVLSPSTRLFDLNVKRHAYAAAGVAAYWIVDPAAPGLVAYRLDGDRPAYVEEASVVGDQPFVATLPCPVTVVASQLLD